MNIAKARANLLDAARGLQGNESALLEEAAMTFARVKQRNANRRDRWKVRKRLMVSRGEPDVGKSADDRNPASVQRAGVSG
jgi:hypothetical protein